MGKFIKDMNELLNSGKGLVIILAVVLGIIIFSSKSGVEGDGNTVDNSNKVTASSDNLSDNAVKIGDIEDVKGDIIIKK